MLRRFSWFSVALTDGQIEILDPARLPRDWRSNPVPSAARKLGQEWLVSKRSLALAVPSAIVPEAWNYVLNPAHPEFASLEISASRPFRFDARIVTRFL